jgi:sugar O-acyltransferase (sialic acid O-acetyltransferase NeuD family)
MDKLILLGHSEGGIGVLMDIAYESNGIKTFEIVKNIDRPNCEFEPQLYNIRYFKDSEYDFKNNTSVFVQFGVHHSHFKNIIYNHFLFNFQINKDRFQSIFHSSAYIAPSAIIEKGILVEPMVVISSFAKIGFGVNLKRSASLGHHCALGDFVNINPGVVLSGFVTIGYGTEVGSGTVISNNIKIGEKCLIGAGSVVTKDIPDGVIAYGNPCRVIRQNERWSKIL